MDSRSRSKNKESAKVDPSRSVGSSTHSQDREAQLQEDDYVYAPVGAGLGAGTGGAEQDRQTTRQKYLERTIFVVDLSKLKEERDTLEGAIVMYKPEREFKKAQYEQRCSQLVGLSLCTESLTGKYPEFLRLKGTGYAIRGLGEHYIMGLSSRVEEPPAYCVNYLKTIHDLFRFYYHSPSAILKASNEEWEVFTHRMTDYLSNIMRFILQDQHSVQGTLDSLTYFHSSYSSYKKNGARNYLLASRILRACQSHLPIVGGCLMQNEKLVMSQFPPDFTDKLLLVGGRAISLNTKSVLEDNIAPGKVWVLEVFLTREEETEALGSHKDHSGLKNAYASLNRAGRVTVPPIQLHSSTESGPDPVRSRGHWQRRTGKSPRMQLVGASSTGTGDLPPTQASQLSQASQPTYDTPRSTILKSSASQIPSIPVDSSTPLPKDKLATEPTRRNSQEAVSISPGLSTVFFDKVNPDMLQRNSSSSSGRLDGDESEYVDAVETMDYNPPSPPKQIPLSKDSPTLGSEEGRPESVSSEVFATPSPSPPRDRIDSKGGSKEEGDGSTLTRENASKTGFNPANLTDDELTKLINTPVFMDTPDKSSGITTVSSTQKTHAMAIPPSWKFRAVPESDDEDDFVDSDALQAMLGQKDRPKVKSQVEDDDFVDADSVGTMLQDAVQKKSTYQVPTSKTAPPPLPPRNPISSRTSTQSLVGVAKSPIAPPPLPPRNYTLNAPRTERSLTYSEGVALNTPENKQWLYKTMKREEAGISSADGDGAVGDMENSYEELDPPFEESTNQSEDEEMTNQSEGEEVTNQSEDGESANQSEDEGVTPAPLDVLTPVIADATTPDMAGEYLLSGKDLAGLVPSSVDVVDTQVSPVEPATAESAQTSVTAVEQSIDIYGDSPDLSISRKVVNPDSSTNEPMDDQVTASVGSGTGVKRGLEEDGSVVKSKVLSYDSQPDVDQRSLTLTSEIESSFEVIPDGTHSPSSESVMAFDPESLVDGLPMRLKLLRHRLKAPTLPPRRPVKEKQRSKGSDQELSDADDESSDLDSVGSLDETRGQWLPTLKRPHSANTSGPYISKMSLYVQQYMSTVIILLGGEDLHKNHKVLNSLWRSLLQQLTELDSALKKEASLRPNRSHHKPTNTVIAYSSLDRRCEVVPRSTAYQFRHALRRIHREYVSDPSLLEVSLSCPFRSLTSDKDSLRVLLSQSVHKREVYFNPSHHGHLDVLSSHGSIEKNAKMKSKERQQPPESPKVMFL